MSKKPRWKKSNSSLKQGTKEEQENSLQTKYDENSPVIQSFLKFQSQLDAKYDKRERLIKLSRDITIFSKRLIFQLHRFPQGVEFEEIAGELEPKLQEIKDLLEKTAKELDGEDPYLFVRAYTGGVQEFIEAVTFMHYIGENRLLGYDELCLNYFTFSRDGSDAKLALLLRPMDYILGIADLTGELMRMCINYMGAGHHEKSNEICVFLRKVHNECLLLSGKDFRDFNQKMKVLGQSLRKVENACYTVHLRAKEIPKNMLVDLLKMKDPVNEELMNA